jgi:hypothetical protein
VTLPYTDLFLGLLAVYMVYSVWTRLDSRYPIACALVLLVVAAVVDASGASGAANTIAVYVFFLLAAGVILLLIDHVREPRKGVPTESAASQSGDGRAHDPANHTPDDR